MTALESQCCVTPASARIHFSQDDHLFFSELNDELTDFYVGRVDLLDGYLQFRRCLWLDLGPLDEPLVIYELFIPRRLRRGGLGTKLLKATEQIARELGYKWTLVIPRTMDDVFPQADLELWYRRNHYEVWEEHAAGGLRKRI